MTTKPRAYRLGPQEPAPGTTITEDPYDAVEAADGTPVPVAPRRRGPPWAGLLLAALCGLATLGLGLALERLVAELYALAPGLGWLALALALLAAASLLALVLRELLGVFRERRIERMRAAAAAALAVRDHAAARAVAAELAAFYGGREGSREARARVAGLADEIIDADDRLAIAERELLAPLDAQAKRAVARAARQVSLVTALSPRAVLDVGFVVFAAMRLLRQVAAIYGGRPGALGFLRLARQALNHLAVTGGVAVGDSLLQQALGLGLAARVSAKLGEGVLNGLMTARFGLAAIEVCRPLPFVREEPPRIGDVAGELLAGAEPPAGQGRGLPDDSGPGLR